MVRRSVIGTVDWVPGIRDVRQAHSNAKGQSRSILLIDDDAALCILMAEFFAEHNFRIDAVHDGAIDAFDFRWWQRGAGCGAGELGHVRLIAVRVGFGYLIWISFGERWSPSFRSSRMASVS